MASPTEIRATIGALLAGLDADVRVAPGPIEYLPGQVNQAYTVRVVVGPVGDERAELLLDELIAARGERSVKALVEADRKLGGLVANASVARCTGWQVFSSEHGEMVGATFTVATIAAAR